MEAKMSDEKAMTGRELVKKVVGEVAAMEYAGDVAAIAVVVIDGDGDVRCLTAFCGCSKLPLMAGSMILQRDLMAQVVAIQKPTKI
jgi:hypothetical protein